MEENYTGDCYICSMENLDSICEMLLAKGCTIENVVPVEYKFYLFKMVASKLCITFRRPYGMPVDDDPSPDIGPGSDGPAGEAVVSEGGPGSEGPAGEAIISETGPAGEASEEDYSDGPAPDGGEPDPDDGPASAK